MKYTYLIVLVIVNLLMVGCSVTQETRQQVMQEDKIIIATTFYPLYYFTKNVVGDKGSVYSIVPAGSEPHDYEPIPSDIQKLNSAKVFVTMGIEFEEFEDTLISSIDSSVKIIPAGKNIQLLKATDEEEKLHSGIDPHIWISPKNARVMVENIINGLIALNLENAPVYINNGNNFLSEINTLDVEFKDGLANCKKHTILVNHNAFSYLGKDYGFNTIYISGLDPEVEPTPKQIKELIDSARKEKIRYVFYEELVDPRIAKTIAKEVKAQVLELSPLEGTTNQSDTYITLMRHNLKNLEVALECQ